MRAIERDVLGCDFGGTSWTTRFQADLIPAALGLTEGVSLLEIGAGTGWPGIYLAHQSGCHVTLVDIPVNSLGYAQRRAVEENVGKRCRAIAASGEALPFVSAAFPAISHSDVLCCLPDKLAMLKECRRVASDAAMMLFYVIAPARGLSSRDLDRACEIGPPFVGLSGDYAGLLEQSGWDLITRTDLTTDYLQALQRLADGLECGATTLEEVLGKQEFRDQLQHRRDQIDTIERGLLEREMFLARVG